MAAWEQSKSTKLLNISIIKKGGVRLQPWEGGMGGPNGLYSISFHYQGAIYTLLTQDSVFSCAEIVSHCRWDVDSGAIMRANMASHIREDRAEARDERWYLAMAVDFPSNFPLSQTIRIIEPKGNVFVIPIMSRRISKWCFHIIIHSLMFWHKKILLCHSSLSTSGHGLSHRLIYLD